MSKAHAQVEHDFVTLPKPEFRTPGGPEHFIDGYGRAHSLDCRGCRIDSLLAEIARLRDAGPKVVKAWDRAFYAARENGERAETAEARCVTLTEALAPFAAGVEAFDRAESTYGDGAVFARTTQAGHWEFTIADVRRAAAVLAGSSGGEKP